MNLNIKGKIAVITAASKELGRAVAESLAKEGVNLALCARNKNHIQNTAECIKNEYNVDVVAYECDVSSPNDINTFTRFVIDHFKTCHILFTNAGGPPSGRLSNFTTEDIRNALDLNLISTVNLVNAFLPYMKSQKWGRILASTSSNIRQLLPQFPLSNISRISVLAYIKTLAGEIAPYNITANVLAPGIFLTEPTKEYIENIAKHDSITYDAALNKIKKTIPVNKIGKPEDYGALAAFLVSEQAEFITGESFLIDGGAYCTVI
jgi:3-oxoacyl-[acyl-carrier protein] reductase